MVEKKEKNAHIVLWGKGSGQLRRAKLIEEIIKMSNIENNSKKITRQKLPSEQNVFIESGNDIKLEN